MGERGMSGEYFENRGPEPNNFALVGNERSKHSSLHGLKPQKVNIRKLKEYKQKRHIR
jgi:hypothetical protein